MVRNQTGFTLIESLFVLSVFLIIASVSAFLIKPQFTSLEKQQFISQLQADLLFAQAYALSHHMEINVLILPEEKRYLIYKRQNEMFLIEREIPEMIHIRAETMKLNFYYQADGNINRFGSFAILAGKDRYKFTFLIGKGRFYVEKE